MNSNSRYWSRLNDKEEICFTADGDKPDTPEAHLRGTNYIMGRMSWWYFIKSSLLKLQQYLVQHPFTLGVGGRGRTPPEHCMCIYSGSQSAETSRAQIRVKVFRGSPTLSLLQFLLTTSLLTQVTEWKEGVCLPSFGAMGGPLWSASRPRPPNAE